MKQQHIATPAITKAILAEHAITPSKSLGQNFLISETIVEQITHTADLQPADRVVEIGPGLGALSEALAPKAAALCLVELDARLYHHLQHLFAGQAHVELFNADARSFQYAHYAAEKGWPDYKIITNLPYNITADLIKELLLYGGPWQSMTLMVQREVAQKLSLGQSQQVSGPLALLMQYYGKAKLAFTVPPSAFIPQPEVHSAVLHLQRWTTPAVAVENEVAFAKLLWAAFAHRRKSLENCLASGALGGDKEFWRHALTAAGIGEGKRAEQLALHDFASLLRYPPVQEMLATLE